MTLEDDIKKALIPDAPIKRGRLITARGGNPGERVWVEVEGSPISRQLTCATVVNDEAVTVIGGYVFCASAPRTSLSRTLEYSRYRPIGQPIKTGGKIKYLYSVANTDGSSDLYVGGWLEEPVRVKTIDTGDSYFVLNNTGGNGYLINYFNYTDPNFTAITLNESGVLYQNSFPAFGQSINLGYGYFAGADIPGVPNTIYQLYQSNFLSNLAANLDINRSALILPLLPNVIQPFGTSDAVQAKTQNASGTRGVGLVDNIPFTYVATYDTTGTITRSARPITRTPTDLYLISQHYDCFDTYFTAINGFTLNNIFTSDKISLDVGVYDFLGERSSVLNFDTYGIPASQRSSATFVGRPSYNPD